MANYTALVQALVASINQRVTVKDTIDSIDPIDAGGSMTDIPNTLLAALNTINEFNILGGTSAPDNSLGIEDDVYIQHGVTFAFWKKDNNSWVQKVVIDLGINIVDGNINLQSSISGQVVTVSAGQWGINNVIYTKATQDQFTLTGADLNFDRIDAVFANTSNTVHYVAGTASSNPDGTKPVTPTDEVIVCYIYVPSVASGNPPYISDSQTSVSPPPGPPLKDWLVTKSGSDVTDYELDLSAETDIPYPANATLYVNKKAQSAATWDFDTKTWTGLPDTVSGDVIEAYYVGREYVAPVFTATLLIENNSDQNVDYTIGVLIGTITPGNNLSGPTIPGQSASVDLLSGQSCVYTIYNSDDSVDYTFTQSGPSTLNGLPMTDNQRQEFIIYSILT